MVSNMKNNIQKNKTNTVPILNPDSIILLGRPIQQLITIHFEVDFCVQENTIHLIMKTQNPHKLIPRRKSQM